MNDGPTQSMGIAELADRAGVTPRTIRYYVAEGLLPAPGGRGQRRAYTGEHLARLEEIRHLKAAYLPLHEIRSRLRAMPVSLPPRTAEGLGVGAPSVAAPSHTVLGDRAPQGATATASAAVVNRPPIGFGGAPGIGRIEIYDPPETVWHRHVLVPGVELHYQETDDPRLAEAIKRLLREAAAILDASPSKPKG